MTAASQDSVDSPVPTEQHDQERHEQERPDNPWARWGWLMWIVWLLFLLFPAASVLEQTDQPLWWRVTGIGLIAGFAVLYVVASWRVMKSDEISDRTVLTLLAGLILIPVLGAFMLGVDAVAFTPFLVSFTAFSLERPWHWIFAVATVVLTVGIILLTQSLADWGFFIVILVSVAIAVNVARLLIDQSYDYGEVQTGLVITAERERVARDVHDVLGHSLTVVSVKAGLAERLIDVDPERARAEMADIGRIARESLAEVRATVGGLRAAALATEVTEAGAALASAGIELDLQGDPSDVDPAHRTVLGWVLREAVTNVVRHSGAASCRIELDPHSLVIEDDGVGMRDHLLGNGLRGLRERVNDAGARLDIGPGRADRGTRLEVAWPS